MPYSFLSGQLILIKLTFKPAFSFDDYPLMPGISISEILILFCRNLICASEMADQLTFDPRNRNRGDSISQYRDQRYKVDENETKTD